MRKRERIEKTCKNCGKDIQNIKMLFATKFLQTLINVAIVSLAVYAAKSKTKELNFIRNHPKFPIKKRRT